MKNKFLFLALLFSVMSIGQTTIANKLKILSPDRTKDTLTQVVVRDSINSLTKIMSRKDFLKGISTIETDPLSIHLVGAQTIGAGEKTFEDNVNFANITVSGPAYGVASADPNAFVINSQLTGLDVSQTLQEVTETGATSTVPIVLTQSGLNGGNNAITVSSVSGSGVNSYSTSGSAIYADSDNGTGINGNSWSGNAVYGNSPLGTGINGYSSSGFGIKADSYNGIGIYASSTNNIAIRGFSTNNIPFVADMASSNTKNIAEFKKNDVNQASISHNGNITGNSFIKSGGNGTNILLDNGTTTPISSFAGWSLTGNTGTNPTTNYIGTSDDVDLIFKRDNKKRLGFEFSNTINFYDDTSESSSRVSLYKHGFLTKSSITDYNGDTWYTDDEYYYKNGASYIKEGNISLFNNSYINTKGGNFGIGTKTLPEKLTVNGYSLATGYKIPSGLSTQYLMADGSVSTGSGSGDSIPLSGTTVGNPVTGNILFQKITETPELLIYNDGEWYIEMTGVDGVNNVAISSEGRIQTKRFTVNDNSIGAIGITALQDFSANITDLDYTQKIYVDTHNSLKPLDEGNGIGWSYGTDRTLFGNIGLDAFDFSYSDTVSSTLGATGESSFNTGISNTASGYNSSNFGYLNTNNSVSGFIAGTNNQSDGYVNSILGAGNDVTGTNITVVGQAANIVSESTASNNISSSPVFIVGNGTITDADPDYAVATRSDALIVRKSGIVEAPSLTTALIESGTNETLVTKDWSKKRALTDENNVFIYTDFLSTVAATQSFFNGVSSSGGTVQLNSADGELEHPGVVSLLSAAAINTGYHFQTSSSQMLLSGDEQYTVIFKLIDITDTKMRFGFHDATGIVDTADGVYFEVTNAGLDFKTSKASTKTTNSVTTLSANTWYKLKITINSNVTSALGELFDSSGSLITSSTITTNLPDTSANALGVMASAFSTIAQTAAQLLRLDYMSATLHPVR